jgi:high-affinity Fe2+/Pb2+ permease
MRTVFFILMSIAMVAVVAILLLGVLSMAKGGEFNRKYGNKLMRARVLCQGLAIAFFILAILASRS